MGEKVLFVKEIYIEKFRAIENLTLPLGNKITAIAGQNGTMKTTILGMIGQPFSTRNKTSPLYEVRTIEGTRFDSPFKEKFKLSYPDFDKPGGHKWKLIFNNKELFSKQFIEIESIRRSEPKKKLDDIRFWSTEGREENMGYIQFPVIYLSLKRMIPIGEEKVKKRKINLQPNEINFYNHYHNDLLLLQENNLTPEYIQSSNKKTLGAKTDKYDALANSAGQDNVGKILLSIMSFARLKREYSEYKGGLLLIDEIESTLFPAAQLRLLTALINFSRKYKLQIIFTTHSLCILEALSEYDKRNNDIKILYLVKKGNGIEMHENPPSEAIKNDINVSANILKKQIPNKITVYCEDEEARCILKALLPRGIKQYLNIAKENLGCENLKSLARRGVREFTESIILIDGDTSKPRMSNFVRLPGTSRPENVFYNYLYALPDDHEIWDEFGGNGYTKQFCFQGYPGKEQMADRESAKKWFIEQEEYWGPNMSRVIKHWKRDHEELFRKFQVDFVAAYNYLARKKGVPSFDVKNP